MKELPTIDELVKRYEDQAGKIEIPPDLTPSQIHEIDAELDALYQEVAFDKARIDAALRRVRRWLDLAKRAALLEAKEKSTKSLEFVLPEGLGGKTILFEGKLSNSEERQAYATLVAHSLQVRMGGRLVSIVEVLDQLEELAQYMDALVSIIKTKHDRLITGAAAHKIEAGFDSFGDPPPKRRLKRAAREEKGIRPEKPAHRPDARPPGRHVSSGGF